MKTRAGSRRGLHAPLALQILGLLLGGLVVAQLTTLCLTLLLPPSPPSEYRLDDIATALKGGEVQPQHARPLVRTLHDRPPSLQSAGWLVSEQSRDDLARLLGTDQANVRLLFYSPLPFAGAETPRTAVRAAAPGGRVAMAPMAPIERLGFMLAQRGPGGGFPGGGFPGGGFPGGGMPGPAPFPGPSAPSPFPQTSRPAPQPAPTQPSSQAPAPQGGAAPAPTSAPAPNSQPQGGSPPPASGSAPGPGGQPPAGASAPAPPATGSGPGGPTGPRADIPGSELPIPGGPRELPTPPVPRGGGEIPPSRQAARDPAPARTLAAEPPVTGALQRLTPDAPQQPSKTPAARADWVLPEASPRGLFGLAPAPFVQGDFVAAERIAPDRWVTVQPVPEPFPNSWQRRVLLWFAISFSLVAPVGYLFARRLVAPLAAFANAAERLGRDPSGPIMALDGPAEIGRAAVAFTGMQQRLKRYIEDRNAMMGAISHDLRTPLARMRFRLERAPSDLKPGMLTDLSQMEDMISSVLVFMREGSEPAVRERLDLRSLIECVVDDAAMVGGDAVLDPGASASVEVDSMSVRRVVTNLVENALKYGCRAHVRLFIDQGDAVTEILDAGPGLPEEELERVFAPFYRASATRTLNKGGIGLGLAVSRSIARAHGGDVRLLKGDQGLVAQLRLPLAQAAA